MARSKQRTTPDDAPSQAEMQTDCEPANEWIPQGTVLWLLTLALVLHFSALFLSYSAIVGPSSTHSRLLDAMSPYLRSTHFSADGRPFYLAHGTADEQPHRLQFASAIDSKPLSIDLQTRWTTIQPAGVSGFAASDRYRRWMGLVATLAQSDQPSLAAALLMPLVSADDSIDAIRIIRLPTELTTAAEDAAPPVYLARVIRDLDQVRLVSIQSKRLTTSPRNPATEQPAVNQTLSGASNAAAGEQTNP